jgi:hypothetical protein
MLALIRPVIYTSSPVSSTSYADWPALVTLTLYKFQKPRREKQRESTDLDLFFFAGKTARSGFPVVSLSFVITGFPIRVIE